MGASCLCCRSCFGLNVEAQHSKILFNHGYEPVCTCGDNLLTNEILYANLSERQFLKLKHLKVA